MPILNYLIQINIEQTFGGSHASSLSSPAFGVANGVGAAGGPFGNEKSVLFDASNQLNHHVSSAIASVSLSSIDLDHSRSSPVSIFTQCDTSAVNNPLEINILHDVSANYRSFNIPDDYEDQSFEETYNLLNEGILPQVPLHLDPKMKNLLTNFLKKIYNEKLSLPSLQEAFSRNMSAPE